MPTTVAPLRSSAFLRSSARSSRSNSSPAVVHPDAAHIELTLEVCQAVDGMARACDSKAKGAATKASPQGLRATTSSFDVVKVLGDGSYSDVYLVQRLSNGQDAIKGSKEQEVDTLAHENKRGAGTMYALKLMTKSKLNPTVCDYLRVEAEVHLSLLHPFIVRMFGSFENEDRHAMLLEYAPGGDLHDLVTNIPNFTLDVTRTRRYMAQLVSALQYLHHERFGAEAGVVHRDLKPENILIDVEQSRIMLADFGFAKVLRKGEGCYSFVGTVCCLHD